MLSAKLFDGAIKLICSCQSCWTEKQVYILDERSSLYSHCGGYGGEDPPVLIPNTEVKLSCAESTLRATAREDRSPPHFNKSNPKFWVAFFVVYNI